MDLTTLEDAELDKLRRRVLTEQERRDNLAAIPEQISALAEKYRDGGGNQSTLTDAIEDTDPTVLDDAGLPTDA